MRKGQGKASLRLRKVIKDHDKSDIRVMHVALGSRMLPRVLSALNVHVLVQRGGILNASLDNTARLRDRDGKPLAVLERPPGLSLRPSRRRCSLPQ